MSTRTSIPILAAVVSALFFASFSTAAALGPEKLSAKPLSGRAPLDVTFTGKNLSADPHVEYEIDFGNGAGALLRGMAWCGDALCTPPKRASGTFTYFEAGTFKARLIRITQRPCAQPPGGGCSGLQSKRTVVDTVVIKVTSR